jgi:hypothetical protein
MSDAMALLALISVQVFLSAIGASFLASRGFLKASLPSLALPIILLALVLWMTFGMGAVTDLGAMAISVLSGACLIVLLCGLAATAIVYLLIGSSSAR